MPLIVKDHTWTQNQNTVYISVPLKGVKPASVHVTCTDEYLKVRFGALNVKLYPGETRYSSSCVLNAPAGEFPPVSLRGLLIRVNK